MALPSFGDILLFLIIAFEKQRAIEAFVDSSCLKINHFFHWMKGEKFTFSYFVTRVRLINTIILKTKSMVLFHNHQVKWILTPIQSLNLLLPIYFCEILDMEHDTLTYSVSNLVLSKTSQKYSKGFWNQFWPKWTINYPIVCWLCLLQPQMPGWQ